MGRKKKKTIVDFMPGGDDEEWMDDEFNHPAPGPAPRRGGVTPAEEPAVTLRDFMVPEKVNAFVHSYEPCDEFTPGAERFDDARLREYFKAYVCPLGDPLSLYIEDLKLADFRMVTSVATNIPCIFARRKF